MITCNSSYRRAQKTFHNHLASYYVRVVHFSSAFHFWTVVECHKIATTPTMTLLQCMGVNSCFRGKKLKLQKQICFFSDAYLLIARAHNSYTRSVYIHKGC